MSSLIKSIIFSIAMPVVVLMLWSHYSHPIDELRLITQSIETKGYVVKAEEYEEEVEDGNKAGIRTSTYYEYQFTIPNGSIIKNGDILRDEIPDYLFNAKYDPYPVNIQYLQNNPKINRVKELSENQTILQWFRKTFFFGFLILLITSFIGYNIIKDAYKDYLTQEKVYKNYLNKNLKEEVNLLKQISTSENENEPLQTGGNQINNTNDFTDRSKLTAMQKAILLRLKRLNEEKSKMREVNSLYFVENKPIDTAPKEFKEHYYSILQSIDEAQIRLKKSV